MEESNARGSPTCVRVDSQSVSSTSTVITNEPNSTLCSHNEYSECSNARPAKKSRFPLELQVSILLALFHLHFVCGICNEVIIDCICLPCGHNFCTHCLHQWFLFNRICPTCFNPVKDNFKLQRIYCVDEFLAEVYQSVQELSATLFGTLTSSESHSPGLHRTLSEIQASVRNTRIVNARTLEQRLKLKAERRENPLNCPQHLDTRTEYSVLEQQTELFESSHIVNLTAIVQFFLSFVTAYITYEGGDSVDNDYILLILFTMLVWFVIFMAVMRHMGYEGSFTELMMQLNFIEFHPENDNDQTGQDAQEDITDEDEDQDEFQSETETDLSTQSSSSEILFQNHNQHVNILSHSLNTHFHEEIGNQSIHTTTTEQDSNNDHLELLESNSRFTSFETLHTN